MIEASIQEDITFVNIHGLIQEHLNTCSKYYQTERENDHNEITVEHVKTPVTSMDK